MPNYSGGLSGATGGALAGGSVGGPLGALVGGGLGGLAGLFGGNPQEENQQRWSSFYDSIGGKGPAQLGPAHQADYSAFRDNQSNLINRLEAMSRGEGPSVSREMLKEATDRNARQQQSMAQGGRGNAALMAQNAQNNTAGLGAQAAQSAALGRVQEQQGALQALGINLYGARGADEDMNRYNTSGRTRRDEFNANAQNDRYGMDQNARLQALQGMSGNQGPSMGDQILAGGAGLSSFLSGQRANNRQQGSGPGPGMTRNPGERNRAFPFGY